MKLPTLIKFSMIKRKVWLIRLIEKKKMKKCDILDMMYGLLLIVALDNAVVVFNIKSYKKFDNHVH